MSKLKVIWNAPQPRTYKRVLFRYCDGRNWRYRGNWKFYVSLLLKGHWTIISPMLRFTKCNGQVEIGLGNHYFELGW